jgi:tartrate dehydrogenase/decarboxylase/D-malate dehydrogenase
MAASANLPAGDAPALFEPVHGSAPDIAGAGIANPSGAVWSVALMLEHLGRSDAAARVMAALEAVCLSGPRTRDLGGSAGTAQVGDALVDALRRGAGESAAAGRVLG